MTEPEGVLAVPDAMRVRCAVLVLSGSSGRVEYDRVRLLAAHGAVALSLRWFGDELRQPPGICEVALETFTPTLDRLASFSDHLAVVGVSKGAEAALLLACRDQRIRAVVALSPTSVVWANVGPGRDGRDRPQRSSWTVNGVPLPFAPYDDTWTPETIDGAPAFRSMYQQSLTTFADRIAAATIPAERITGHVLLAAGDDDQLWPSTVFAEQIRERRAAHGLPTTTLVGPGAGHGIRFPGEPTTPGGGMLMARGGSPAADATFGRRVWTEAVDVLHLG